MHPIKGHHIYNNIGVKCGISVFYCILQIIMCLSQTSVGKKRHIIICKNAIKQGMPLYTTFVVYTDIPYWMHINFKLLTLPGKLNFFLSFQGVLFLINFFALKSHLFVIQSATIEVCFVLGL